MLPIQVPHPADDSGENRGSFGKRTTVWPTPLVAFLAPFLLSF